MGLRRVLRANRFTCLALTVLFYVIIFCLILQLTHLDLARGIEPGPHYIPDKALQLNQHLSDKNAANEDQRNNGSNRLITDSLTVQNTGSNMTRNDWPRVQNNGSNMTRNDSLTVQNNGSNLLRTDTTTVETNTLEYVDWNDYQLMAKDAQRKGQGEQGAAFNKTLTEEERKLSEQLYNKYKFNAFASDHISVERSIADHRLGKCKTKLYLKNITKLSVSVVVIFHNEKNSTILRLLHGIINRSPARLLKEIVLVDDFSTEEELKEPLENYIHQHFPKVILIRNQQRQGLIRTRMIGANASTGDILLFLDAHIEVGYNYLPPLVEPIIFDYRKIVCPLIDVIMEDSLKIRSALNWQRGAFSWDMVFRRLPVYEMNETLNRPVPAMLGATFAISRRWWEEIEKYDPGLEIWGGEQYEITFKSWMCGGSVVDVPCSRMAHLFRKIPYVEEVLKDNLIERNLLRVATVWMDEYIEYVIQRRPLMRTIDPGDLKQQFALKQRLNCKSFKWFLTEVAPDVPKYFPVIEPPIKAWGMLRNILNMSLCVVNGTDGWIYLQNCQESQSNFYIYDWKQHISFSKTCFSNTNLFELYTYECLIYERIPTQEFVWDPSTGSIVNRVSKYCMDVHTGIPQVIMAPCNNLSTTQSWTFDNFNSTLVDEAWRRYSEELGF